MFKIIILYCLLGFGAPAFSALIGGIPRPGAARGALQEQEQLRQLGNSKCTTSMDCPQEAVAARLLEKVVSMTVACQQLNLLEATEPSKFSPQLGARSSEA